MLEGEPRIFDRPEDFIRKKHQEWFKKSALKEELIAKLWHPTNFEKFKYYDPDMFDNIEDI